MLSQQFIDEAKQKLLETRQKLGDELVGLNAHDELGDDMDANAQEVENDEVSQDMIARLKTDLEKINRALAKIEDGTYGMDDQGNPISEDRLKALPWASESI